MNPAVLARFGPWFGRLIKSSPALLANLVNKLRASGKVVESSVEGVIAYAKANPTSFSLVLATLAELGVSVYHLFGHDDVSESEKAAALKLEHTAIAVPQESKNAAFSRVLQIAASSETLREDPKKPDDREERAELLAQVCGWAKGFFGNAENAINGHGMLQAFVELPRKDVVYAFNHLKLEV